jgi:hypothetical protein
MAAQQPTFDPAILSRLEAFGSYRVHWPSLLGRWLAAPAEIEWDEPLGFANDLAPTTVALWFSSGRNSADELRRSLDALDAFRTRLAVHIAELENYLVDSFRYLEPHLSVVERQAMADVGGSISNAAILRGVRSMHVRFCATAKTVLRTAWFDVPWDEEHGLEVEWDEAGNLALL